MHSVLNLVKEPLVDDLSLFGRALHTPVSAPVLVDAETIFAYLGKLILRVDIWHDTRIQHVLDIFKEGLVDDIVVRENEDSLELLASARDSDASEGSDLVKLDQLVSEVLQSEVLLNLQLIYVHTGDESG